LLRNVCVVLGNIGTADDLPALQRAENHEEPLVREHAAWAVREIVERINRDRRRVDAEPAHQNRIGHNLINDPIVSDPDAVGTIGAD
jgi:hypothetical protein